MAWVTEELIAAWEDGTLVGDKTPKAVVQIQRGYWQRDFRSWGGPAITAKIWGEGGYGDGTAQAGHWFPVWVPTTGWIDVPNIGQIQRRKDLQQNGITVGEITIDAQDYVPKVGALGDAYHIIAPGYLASSRGQTPVGPRATPIDPTTGAPWDVTAWTGIITDGVKIRVWQGFGDPEIGSDGSIPPVDGGTFGAWTFAGQIDDVDVDSDPNTITITARNGKLITDQFAFGWAKSKRIPDPVRFYDDQAATYLTMVGSAAAASSSADGFPAKNVLDVPRNQWSTSDPAYATKWESGSPISPTDLEWIDIRLAQGTYDEFWLQALSGLVGYVGIYAHSIVHHTKDANGDIQTTDVLPRMREVSAIDGTTIASTNLPVGWVNRGFGNAPGAKGGWPYIRNFTTGTGGSFDRVHLWQVGSENPRQFDLGARSVLRLGLVTTSGSATAWVSEMHGLRRRLYDDIQQQRFILVPDASEVVKVVLRWCGFQEWDVEEAGVRLASSLTYANDGTQAITGGSLTFNRTDHLIDIITKVAQQLGFIFFIADPTDANSDGVPTFRHDSSLLVDNTYVAAEATDETMLTGLKRKGTDSERPFIIRVRGNTATASDGGVPLGGDTLMRIMAVFTCPWAYGDSAGGIVRHMIHQDDQLTTYAMCLMGCYLIALGAALQMYTVEATIPCHPIIELDDQISIIDTPTATNSRMWVTKSDDTMKLGDGASWVQTLDGCLIDTLDFWHVLNGYTPPGHGHLPGALEIDWSHVTDPNTSQVSGSIAPVLLGVHLEPRTR